MAIDKIMSKKVFLQDDDKVQGAYVNTARRFPPSFSHKSDTFNLTKYIKDIVATVLTGGSTVFVSITALSANIGKNLFGFGTALLPSITFNTDNNTGIYRSAADTIGFTSGGTNVANLGPTGLKLAKTTVTQGTNISTTVVVNAPTVVLTTQGATAAANATNSFTVTNSAVAATDLVLISILDYAGTTGKPVVTLDAKGTGTFNVVITNVDSTNALNGALTLAIVVL